jgi:hypothetical protein
MPNSKKARPRDPRGSSGYPRLAVLNLNACEYTVSFGLFSSPIAAVFPDFSFFGIRLSISLPNCLLPTAYCQLFDAPPFGRRSTTYVAAHRPKSFCCCGLRAGLST